MFVSIPQFFKCLFIGAVMLFGSAGAGAAVYVSYDSSGQARFASERLDASFHLLVPDAPVIGAVSAPNPALSAAASQRRAQLDALFTEIANRHGIDPALVKAVAHVESRFNTAAVSPKGATGVMQMMPATAARYGAKQLKDARINLDAGTRHLKDLLAQYDGNLPLALAAYNAGGGAVKRYGKNIPPFRETMLYVPEVLTHYEGYRQLSPSPR